MPSEMQSLLDVVLAPMAKAVDPLPADHPEVAKGLSLFRAARTTVGSIPLHHLHDNPGTAPHVLHPLHGMEADVVHSIVHHTGFVPERSKSGNLRKLTAALRGLKESQERTDKIR